MIELSAPDPVHSAPNVRDVVTGIDLMKDDSINNPSVVRVTIAACGGAGLNTGRPFGGGRSSATVLNFDTSMTNSRSGETVNIVTNGNGSGSHRAENSRDIERVVTGMTDQEIGLADVGIVMFSAAGGSGSVLGPVIAREYARRNMRVIVVVILDTSSTVGAKNTINTLKTLTAIANNTGLYLPSILLSNDSPRDRRGADEASYLVVNDLLDILTKPVHEVDRNDRLNWINPSKVVGAKAGLKLMQLVSEQSPSDSQIVIGYDSEEMVDSLLITQNADEESLPGIKLPLSRLKKAGFYNESYRPIVGKVTGDIKAVDKIIDSVERVQQIDSSQNYGKVDRLNTDGGGDLIL